MICYSRLSCLKPSTPTVAGSQKKKRPAAGGRPSQRAAIIRMMLPPENCGPNRESQSANNHEPHGPWQADRVGREPDKWRADQESGISHAGYDSQPSAVEG